MSPQKLSQKVRQACQHVWQASRPFHDSSDFETSFSQFQIQFFVLLSLASLRLEAVPDRCTTLAGLLHCQGSLARICCTNIVHRP